MHYAYIMPRSPSPPSKALQRAVDELKEYLRANGLSENAFAKRHQIVQSTVHRLVSGRTKSPTPAAKKILGYANIAIDSGISGPPVKAVDNPRLRAALERAWDGRQETTELLASLIEAVGAAIRLPLRTK
jgi:hypothetical protein